jgi:hypothetical protein
MAVDVTVETTIRRPVAVVAEYVSDPSNAPEWYRRISSATWRTEPPVAVGSQIGFRARFLGRDLVYTYEVVELTDAGMTMRTAEGPFPMTTVYAWHAIDAETTSMSLRNHGEPTGFSKLAAPAIAAAMRRAMTADLAHLKQLLDSTGRPDA